MSCNELLLININQTVLTFCAQENFKWGMSLIFLQKIIYNLFREDRANNSTIIQLPI